MNLIIFNQQFLKAYNMHNNQIIKTKYMTSFAHGYCYLYAVVASEVLGAKAYSYLDTNTKYQKSGHCFIKIGSKFYDSECYLGTENYKNLQPYLKRTRNLKTHSSSLGIWKTWGFNKNHETVILANKIIRELKLSSTF